VEEEDDWVKDIQRKKRPSHPEKQQCHKTGGKKLTETQSPYPCI
jgi:hypothetical protein